MCGNSLIIRSASQILPGRWPAGNADVPGTAYISALSFGNICTMCTASRHTPRAPLGGLLKLGRFLRSPWANIPGEASGLRGRTAGHTHSQTHRPATPTPDTPAGHAHSQTRRLAKPTPRHAGWPYPSQTRGSASRWTHSPHITRPSERATFLLVSI